MKLLVISTDRSIFKKDSPVALRMIEYAKNFEELHIVVFRISETESSESQAKIELAPNFWIYSTQSRLRVSYPFDAIRLGASIIKVNGITDITCQDPFLTAMAGISLKKRFNIPLEIQVHTDIGSPYYTYNFSNKIYKILAKKYLPQADKIRVVSNRIRQYLIELCQSAEKDSIKDIESRIEVRPIEVDIDRIKNASIIESADLHKKYPQFEKIVLMASRLEPEKDIGLAIKAWVKVNKVLPKAGLIIVGEGSESAKCKVQSAKFNLDKFVIFEHWADQVTLTSYYKTADLFLMTSLYEGYGMTLIEAQAAGCKIVSTDVGVAKEVGAKTVEHDADNIARGIIERLS